MEGIKHKITIIIEVLDVESAPNLITQMMKNNPSDMPFECLNGSLTMCDGDHIEWKTESAPFKI